MRDVERRRAEVAVRDRAVERGEPVVGARDARREREQVFGVRVRVAHVELEALTEGAVEVERRDRRGSGTRQGRLFPSGVPERIGHPHVGWTAAEDADSATDQGGLIAAYVVVETQAWRPQDVAARESTRVDVQD